MKNQGLILAISILFALEASAQSKGASANDAGSPARIQPAQVADTPDVKEPETVVDSSSDVGIPPNLIQPAQKKRRRVPEKKVTFAHSEFTSDKSESEADHRALTLAMGIDKIVDLDPKVNWGEQNGSVFEGNTAIIRVVPARIGNQRQLIFKGIGEGETNVAVRDRSGKVKIIFDVFVAKQNIVRYVERLRDKLKEVEGITVNIEDQKVVIRGEVLSPSDYGLIINELADKTYGDSVVNKATMSSVTMNALAKRIEQDVQVFAPTVHCSVLNGKIILEGSVESPGIRDRALRRAEWYLPSTRVSEPIAGAPNVEKNDKPLQIIQSDIQITPPPPKRESKLVRLTVYFVELSKDFLKTFGFKWQPGFTADPSISIGSTQTGTTATNTAGGFTFAGTLSSLFPTLNAPPSSATFGRILKSETMIVKSQEKAQLVDQQEIPTQSLGQNGTVGNGPPVKVGFSTEITPTILQGQDVDLSISLDQNNRVGIGANNVPIIATHHVGTRIYVKSGEVAAVAGVNNQDIATSFNRDDPNSGTFTAGTKPLFTLQRSKNMAKKRGQFVVFISPQIIESASEGTEDLKRNFRMPSGH